MKSSKQKVITLLLLAPVLIYFWPSQLYGNTSYIMLLGDSMVPTIESGTLVIVQPDEQYHIGDLIAFVNEDGINLVHRIVEVTDEGFVTKGDNNPRSDRYTVTYDDVVGRAVFVVPYLGFTSLLLKTPLGISMIGIWAVVMLVPRKSGKSKMVAKESFAIFSAALATNAASYVMTQIVLGINIKIFGIPFSGYLEPSMASTASFALWTTVILLLYFMARNFPSSKTKGIDPIKIITIAGSLVILVTQLINVIYLLPYILKLVL